MPALRDVACNETQCVALTAAGLVSLEPGLPPLPLVVPADAAVLRVDAGAWATLPSPPPPPLLDDPPPLAEQVASFTVAWNAGIAAHWRSRFQRIVLGPGGGVISWTRGAEGGGQLMRIGAGRAFARVSTVPSPVSYPAWLALHPTGTEAYLLAWPTPVLAAFDPVSVVPRWSVELGGAGHGLFVDPEGRWLLAEIGPGRTDRLVDWPLPAPDPTRDLADDAVLRTLPRPDATEVVVVDLAAHAIAFRANGAHRRWLALPGGRYLLATDREAVFFRPEDPPA